MTSFVEGVRSGLTACRVGQGSTLLIAVSGGADSVALLRGMAALRDERIAHLTKQVAEAIEPQINADVTKWVQFFTGAGRSTFERWLKRSGRYAQLFRQVLQKEGKPPDLVHLVFVESGFNVHARSVSAAVGPWQFLRSTGRLFGLTVNQWVDERKDPEKSTVAAARYLKHLYSIFGDWPLALASYNAGEGTVLRAIKKQGTTNYWDLRLPRQTEADRVRHPLQGDGAGLLDVEGNPRLQGENVGGAEGEKGQGDRRGGEAVDDLVEGAVAAGGDDPVEALLFRIGGRPAGIAPGAGQGQLDAAALARQVFLRPADARHGVAAGDRIGDQLDSHGLRFPSLWAASKAGDGKRW